ncbi:Ribosomal protein S10p/S20e [Asimina triloba]
MASSIKSYSAESLFAVVDSPSFFRARFLSSCFRREIVLALTACLRRGSRCAIVVQGRWRITGEGMRGGIRSMRRAERIGDRGAGGLPQGLSCLCSGYCSSRGENGVGKFYCETAEFVGIFGKVHPAKTAPKQTKRCVPHSWGIASEILEEGGDDVKSAWPLWAGPQTCYNGNDNGKQGYKAERVWKDCLSSDCSLQLGNMKLELLVIVDQHAAVNMYPGHVFFSNRSVDVGKKTLFGKLEDDN